VSASATVHPLVLDPDYPSLKRHLIESTGLAYYVDKDVDLAARISARLSELTLDGCGAYLDLLRNRQAGEPERHLLIGLLTIGETYFFRYTEQFDALRDVVIPDVLERNRASRTLRIWSAGCAIGAEPYSVAILLKQHFGDRLGGWDVRILGTDINQAFLARATRGEFDERALRSTPDEVKREWFLPSGPSGHVWVVKPLLKEWVSFQYHNLVEHPYPSVVHGIAALDVILCRNVMIYFDWEVIGRILGRFHECLSDGGWLAVGHAESNTDVFRTYRTVNVPGATLYQKNENRPPIATSPAASLAGTPWHPSPAPQPWSPPVLPAMPDDVRSGAAALAQKQAAPALSDLAVARRFADQGEWLEAARRFESLVERERLNPLAHFYQGVVLEQMNRVDAAERAFRAAIYLDRTFVLAHYHLALLLGKTGRQDSAVQSLRNVQGLLAKTDEEREIPDADGLTVGDLVQLTAMHMDLWRK
jgi:chemotaxis protein methyltransferase CheR